MKEADRGAAGGGERAGVVTWKRHGSLQRPAPVVDLAAPCRPARAKTPTAVEPWRK